MFQLLIALAVFGGVVWVIAHAIFMLMRGDGSAGISHEPSDPISRFVEENYGSRFVPENPLGEESLRRL